MGYTSSWLDNFNICNIQGISYHKYEEVGENTKDIEMHLFLS